MRAGFTILELAVTLASVVLVAGIAIGAWFGRSDVTLANAAELFAHDLRMAQAHAQLRGAPLVMTFDADGGGYGVRDLASELPDGDATHRRWDENAVFEGVALGHLVSRTPGRIVVDGRGFVAGPISVTLTFAGHATTVVVDERSQLVQIADALR